MSAKLPLGWDAYMAMNGAAPPPPVVLGGRLAITGLSYIGLEDYYNDHPTYATHCQQILVNICTWLLGGQSSGTILVSNDNNGAGWSGFTDGPAIGTTARAALTSAGFTVNTYTGSDGTQAIGNCDLVILGGEGQADATNFAARRAALANWVLNDEGAILNTYFHYSNPSPITPFFLSQGYLYFAGPHNPAWMVNAAGDPIGTPPTGAMGNTFVAGSSDRFYLYWGGQITCGAYPAFTYPDGYHGIWDFNSQYVIDAGGALYHGPIFGAYTAHGDLGHAGVAW
jgi:hypothetical protein